MNTNSTDSTGAEARPLLSADYSQTEQTYMIMTKHINGNGRLFGGQLLAWIDEVAGIVARRHARTNVVTAAIDNIHFAHQVLLDDMLVLVGRITYVGKSSMEVRIDSFIEDNKGMRRMINRAFLTMVAIDERNRPYPVPGLLLESDQQSMEFASGHKRSELRRERRKEGY